MTRLFQCHFLCETILTCKIRISGLWHLLFPGILLLLRLSYLQHDLDKHLLGFLLRDRTLSPLCRSVATHNLGVNSYYIFSVPSFRPAMVDGGGTAAIASAIQTTFPSTPEGGEKGPDIFDTTKPRRPLFYDAATAPSIPSSTDMAAETNKTPLEAAALPQTSRQDVIAGVAFVDQTTPALATEGAFLEPNAPTKAIPDTLIPNISQEERGLSRNSSGAAQEVAEDGKKEISSTPTLKGEIGVSEKALSQESGHLRHLAAETSSPSSSSTSEKEEIAVVPNDQDEQNGHDGAPLKQTQSQADKMAKSRIVIIMLSLCMALFLAALDITIIATALPTIAQHFHASAANYTWVGSSYLLACSASVPLWGRLSDIWGRKPVILLANVIFMVGSLVAALSNSIGMLIGGRVIQGIGGGGLVILVNICVSDLFSMRERAKYFGVVGMVWAVAGAVGPVVGGAFTEKVSWRWWYGTVLLGFCDAHTDRPSVSTSICHSTALPLSYSYFSSSSRLHARLSLQASNQSTGLESSRSSAVS